MAIRLFGSGATQAPTSNYIYQFWVFSDNLMDTNTMDSSRGRSWIFLDVFPEN